MKKIIRMIYWKIIRILPAKIVINIENLTTYHRFFKKERAEYFGEKIQWLKLYGNIEKVSKYVDKYAVREYVKETIGEKYLIPLYGVFEREEDINFEKFPNSFVLKLNNGSGNNMIVKNKENINYEKTLTTLNRWLKSDYYKIKKEMQYKNVKNKILCEKYISDKEGKLLDYKFFCIDGNPIFLKVDMDRFSNHTCVFYDMEWKRVNIAEQGLGIYNKEVNKPKNFNEMKEIVKKLSKRFNFVRVDLYNLDGKIYFGELTFTPASGRHAFKPFEEDRKFAQNIKLQSIIE